MEFELVDSARNCLKQGGFYKGHKFEIFPTPPNPESTKAMEDYIDPDVQSELVSMRSMAPTESHQSTKAAPIKPQTRQGNTK